ncbi:hypothetical protein J1N35_036233 [Gossypium stocksii]|uniref:Uncharacterized protein n=1 Tax=Gossypium stocksii TaxID=47602 RepID=A0A9D3UJR2_9ROSI|nr:hypothetical protein J1N35_036233 [Gossypium stocksii]
MKCWELMVIRGTEESLVGGKLFGGLDKGMKMEIIDVREADEEAESRGKKEQNLPKLLFLKIWGINTWSWRLISMAMEPQCNGTSTQVVSAFKT